jgi:hypothetical protein
VPRKVSEIDDLVVRADQRDRRIGRSVNGLVLAA